ncbi:MAG: RelA/SpoT domain-containing protein [Candidatus Rokubacteria bacterium]|nr:RelA/SpoT domain-containing protein [Candidatus Rokubacteria bacterium]
MDSRSRRFIEEYERDLLETRRATAVAGELVRDVLLRREVLFYAVTHRAKTTESVRSKLIEKRYSRPRRQVTDVIGVRIITNHEDEIEAAVRALRDEFQVDEANSVDKRESLGLREFGYRSVHIIARLRAPHTEVPELRPLLGRWFEIQVRSAVENVWAEIEHRVVYKSGVDYKVKGYAGTVYRRFGALAGALEVVDKEFTALREARSAVIDFYKSRYRDRADDRKPFDVARLFAFLEAERPNGLSWREAAAAGRRFMPGVELDSIRALKAARLNTARSLRAMMRTRAFEAAALAFATAVGVTPAEISHLAVVALAVGVVRPRVLETDLVPLRGDAAVEGAVRAGHAELMRRRRG